MAEKKLKVYAVVLAGGSGTRLWPLSRKYNPKQFSEIIGPGSLIQSTYKRLLDVFGHERISIVVGRDHKPEVQRHLRRYNSEISSQIVSEPAGRNTAPATLLGTLKILKEADDAVIFVFPSDHVIDNPDGFRDSIKNAETLARDGFIVTFGIKPVSPETDYGYIEAGRKINEHAFYMNDFVEKPNLTSARKYIKKGNWFWNSGIFAFRASVFISECRERLKKAIDTFGDMDLDDLSRQLYETLPDISVDKAIMESTDNGAVLPALFNWSDVGSWRSVYNYLPKGSDGNVLEGNVLVSNSKNCLIKAESRLVVASGLSDLAVVDTGDAVLISDLSSTSRISSVVEDLKKSGKNEALKHKTVYTPWGYFTDLHSEREYRVKRLVVDPGCRLSMQERDHCLKRWIISKGVARITNGNLTEILKEKDTITISGSRVHRVENTADDQLHIIEVQFGPILDDTEKEQL